MPVSPEPFEKCVSGDTLNAASGTDTVQAALNRVGRRLGARDVEALEELDAAFRAWVEERRGTIHWDYETRLIRAIADVIHVELVEEDPDAD